MSVCKPQRVGPQTLMRVAGAVALAGIVTTWSVTLGSQAALPKPSPPAAQPGSASIRNGVVRITGKLNDVSRTGTGFVVARDAESVTVVTSAHVVRQLPEFEVVFAASPTRRYSIDEVVAIDVESLHGLAVFTLVENVPSAVQPLALDRTASPQPGDSLNLWGYAQASVNPSTLGRGFANREGLVYTMDSRVPEGMSGGPVVLAGRVVALTSRTDEQLSYAVPARVVVEFLEGYGIELAPQPTLTVAPAPPTDQRKAEVDQRKTEVAPVAPVFRMGSLTSGLVFVGADIFNPAPRAASAQACSVLCMNNAECQAMSFETNTGECWLKRAANPHNQPVGNYVSAIKQRVQ